MVPLLLFAASVALPICTFAQEAASPVESTPSAMPESDDSAGQIKIDVRNRPNDGLLRLAGPLANVTRAYMAGDREYRPLPIELNRESTQLAIALPEGTSTDESVVVLETGDSSGQFADGRILFSALDATVHGAEAKSAQARLESQPGNHRIGFWKDAADSVSWSYVATRPGMYLVELTYSLAGESQSTVDAEIAETTLSGRLAGTGSWYRYTTATLGKIYLSKTGDYTLAVQCLQMTGPAAMNLKAVTLRPTSEGQPIVQAEDGIVTCHARDVTVHGVKAQYEPKPEKNTVGFWINADDHVSWTFDVRQPGTFDVEILQGCGTGQGGSDVLLSVDGNELPFVVIDTGHFQNFVPRIIGRVTLDAPGTYDMVVQPVRKAQKAVMDLQQVRLLPVDVK